MSDPEELIYRTVRWFNVLDQPVTATQIWRNLVAPNSSANYRWAGHGVYSLREVQEALSESEYLKAKLGSRWGYYFIKGRDGLVEARLEKHARTQMLMKKARSLAKLLALTPGVRMLALSGSVAMGSAKESSDIDILTVCGGSRMWLTRFLVLAAAQVAGRRRKYWDKEAPGKLCLNHFLSERDLAANADIRNLYLATLYHNVLPLYGLPLFSQWQAANSVWMRRQLMFASEEPVRGGVLIELPALLERVKTLGEKVMESKRMDWLEKVAEKFQRRLIAKHTRPGRSGRIMLSATELAFHPDSKASGLLAKFYQDEGQVRLL